jgi:hypothetical protein
MTARLALCLLLLAACNREHQFTDTEGRRFRVSCRNDCRAVDDYVIENGTSSPSGAAAGSETKAGFALADARGRYLGICDAWKDKSGATWGGSDCRIITCKSDTDCPPAVFMKKPACLNGLCGEEGRVLEPQDIEQLCLAGTGAGGIASETQKKRHDEAILACPSGTCTVPKTCRQP